MSKIVFNQILDENLYFEDYQPLITNFIKTHHSDYTILLSNSGFTQDIEMAKKLKGVNLIIGGHSQTLLKKPEFINHTAICQAGDNCQYMGVIQLKINKKNKLTISEYNIITLNNDYPDNPEIANLINDVEKDYEVNSKKVLSP